MRRNAASGQPEVLRLIPPRKKLRMPVWFGIGVLALIALLVYW
jgi:hypothetical protein